MTRRPPKLPKGFLVEAVFDERPIAPLPSHPVRQHLGPGGIRFDVYKMKAEVQVVMRDAGDNDVGSLLLFLAFDDQLTNAACKKNVRALRLRFPGLQMWVVLGASLKKDYRGKGLGKMLYENAFREVAPAIVIPDHCHMIGGQTSPAAERVWKSLAKHYPHTGRGDSVALYVE